jgi:hypothetical protein
MDIRGDGVCIKNSPQKIGHHLCMFPKGENLSDIKPCLALNHGRNQLGTYNLKIMQPWYFRKLVHYHATCC